MCNQILIYRSRKKKKTEKAHEVPTPQLRSATKVISLANPRSRDSELTLNREKCVFIFLMEVNLQLLR